MEMINIWQIDEMMTLLNFPEEAVDFIDQSADKIRRIPQMADAFAMLRGEYDRTIDCDYLRMLKDMENISLQAEIHPYTGNILLLLAMAVKLHSRFLSSGYSEELFRNSMMDLKYKLIECRLVYGIWGTFVPDWYVGFYRLERFALGRLQFELVDLECGGTCQGREILPGTRAINIHIPRTGTRLLHDCVMDSYRQARNFYRNQFEGGPAVFTCESWLLDPWNLTVLSEDSNLRDFISDFTIIKTGEFPDYSEVWRLFDCLYTGNPDMLPRNTSFRRAYADRIRKGEALSWGCGIFLMD